MENKRKALILCGGSGTRLSPATTEVPKQFLSLVSKNSMIQLTANRLLPLVGNEKNISVITNSLQARWVKEQLPLASLIIEPEARNTAPAIGLASLYMDQDDIMMIFPADHVFKNEDILRERLAYGAEIASSKDVLVTLGIRPTHPHSGLGHIERGTVLDNDRLSFYVSRFVEKPPLELAKQYTKSGRYYWNGGMFIWRVGVFHEMLKKCAPDLYTGLMEIKATNLDPEKTKIIFSKLEKISIDYALLEKSASTTVVLECNDLGWYDIGDWNEYGNILDKDEAGNSHKGNVDFINCTHCVCYNDSTTKVQLTGLKDLAIIKANDRVLICPRNKTQLAGKTAETFKASESVIVNLGAPEIKLSIKENTWTFGI